MTIEYQFESEYFSAFARIRVGDTSALLFLDEPTGVPTEVEQAQAEAIEQALLKVSTPSPA